MPGPVPRKLASAADHPYFNLEWAYKVEVTLDGHVIRNAVVADCDEGYVEVYDVDERGRVKQEFKGDRYVPKVKRMTGRVEIAAARAK